eukprot:2395144-Prymnesium_polylepis.1
MRRTFKARRILLDSSFITRCSIFSSSSGGSLASSSASGLTDAVAGAGGSARAGSADFRAATV